MDSRSLVTPTVVRIKRSGGRIIQDCDVYIGRKMTMGGWNLPESKWANPFKLDKDDSNIDEVLEKYYTHICNRPDLLNIIHELSGKVLGCWCKPNKCHGDVLVYIFEEYRKWLMSDRE